MNPMQLNGNSKIPITLHCRKK